MKYYECVRWSFSSTEYNLTMDPGTTSVKAGLDLPIDCIIRGIYYYPPQIVWRINGTDINKIDSLRGTFHITSSVDNLLNETVYTLKITSMQSGVYSCEYGDDSSSIVSTTLNVTMGTYVVCTCICTVHACLLNLQFI